MIARVIATMLALALTGCVLGPKYARPALAVPSQFRGAPDTAQTESLAQVKWSELFQDDALKQLLDSAFQHNLDLRIAAERILEARAQAGIQRAQQFPELEAGASFTAARVSQIGAFPARGANLDSSSTLAGFSLNWELDIWGRLRRLNEAARAEYLASEEVRHGVITTLASDVTSTYFALRELDLEIAISEQTRDIAERGLNLTKLRKGRGAASGLDVKQAEQLLYSATSQISATRRAIEQTENRLSELMGDNPHAIARGKALVDLAGPAEVPAGLPSRLLEYRPDVRQAEQNLIAANAEIGAAKVQYFPQISLTSFLGGQSRALSDLFTGPARQWNIAPAAVLPIFTADRIRSTVKLTEAQKREAELAYERVVENAFREVSDALVAYSRLREQGTEQEQLVNALRETGQLSRLRYQGGMDSYLQVLDAERNTFQGELTLARIKRDQLLSVVDLYRALGGGWE
jgi:NodT family efflux transporter outer membrane factor (OMF) lipoprotein